VGSNPIVSTHQPVRPGAAPPPLDQRITCGLRPLIQSWRRDLRARNLAKRTIETYVDSADQLAAWPAEPERAVTSWAAVPRDHVSEFIIHLIETRSASTASVRYRALQQLFNWLVAEEEIDVSPMAKMTPPLVPEKPVPVLTDGQLRALLASCKGRDFRDRRDTAMIRLFADTGLRLDELTRVEVEDLDLDDQVAVVLGKGRRPRAVPFGIKTTQALDRYVRARAHHSRAAERPLWLGDNNKQAMTPNGVRQAIYRRGERAGIADLHPTCSATRSPTPGSTRAATRATSCASRAGSPAPWSPATAPPPPMPGPVSPTAAWASATACEGRLVVRDLWRPFNLRTPHTCLAGTTRVPK